MEESLMEDFSLMEELFFYVIFPSIILTLTIILCSLYTKYPIVRDIYWYGLFPLFFLLLFFLSQLFTISCITYSVIILTIVLVFMTSFPITIIISLVLKLKRKKAIEVLYNTEKHLKYAKPKKSFFWLPLLFIVGCLFTYWEVNLAILAIPAIILFRITYKKYEKDLQNAYNQIDIMLTIEKLAGENNSNEVYRVAVQEIENVDPSIIENMSADSRVYFDLVLDGKIPVDDPELMKSAAAIVRGHLKTHPEDKQLVTSAFGENHPILKDLAENPHFDRA